MTAHGCTVPVATVALGGGPGREGQHWGFDWMWAWLCVSEGGTGTGCGVGRYAERALWHANPLVTKACGAWVCRGVSNLVW